MNVKIIHGSPGMGKPLNQEDINKFLERKTNIQLATIESSYPNIQPAWFYYDKVQKKIYITTSKDARKVTNARKNANVYFSVDEDDFPYRCVKGRATVSVSGDAAKNLPIVEKICIKYLGSLDHSYAKTIIDMAKSGVSVVLELTPSFFSTWDFSE